MKGGRLPGRSVPLRQAYVHMHGITRDTSDGPILVGGDSSLLHSFPWRSSLHRRSSFIFFPKQLRQDDGRVHFGAAMTTHLESQSHTRILILTGAGVTS